MTILKGFVLAAPASASGKTTIALGLLRLLSDRGLIVQAAKCGPDYIDPTFHEAASGRSSVNLDCWAMPSATLHWVAASGCYQSGRPCRLIVEGAMGALDGAGPERAGSTAGLSKELGLPLVMVINVARQSDSAVLPVLGLRAADPEVDLRGVILNLAGSDRHERLVRRAMARHGVQVFGCLRRDGDIELPSRHLGLIPAGEYRATGEFLDRAAASVEAGVDVDALLELRGSRRRGPGSVSAQAVLQPPGQRIAIARDQAFAFTYQHHVSAWRQAGAELSFFSPLNDEGPAADCDFVFLPGGYPELNAGRLAQAERFRRGVLDAAGRGALVYGECGGFMVLGQSIVDSDGKKHRMLRCLPHTTSFRDSRLHLGYRFLRPLRGAPFAGVLAGHEFHYSSLKGPRQGKALFEAADADGNVIGPIGNVEGRFSGSFAHVICAAAPDRKDLPPDWQTA